MTTTSHVQHTYEQVGASHSRVPPADLASAVRDVQLENHVHRQRQALQVVIVALDRLDDLARRIRDLLEAQAL